MRACFPRVPYGTRLKIQFFVVWVNPSVLRKSSVADLGCLSRILIFTHPGSRIPDPKTAIKERDEKNLVVIPFYEAINFKKLKIILFLEC